MSDSKSVTTELYLRGKLLSGVVVTAMFVTPAHAIDFTWDAQLSNVWDAESGGQTNWFPDAIPDQGDRVAFSGIKNFTTIDLNGDQSIDELFYGGTVNYTLMNNQLTLVGGVINADGAATHTINSDVVQAGSGDWILPTGVELIVNGQLSGTGTLTKTGDGVLRLAASNPFSGSTRINTGRVVLAHADALGNSNVLLNVNNGLDITTHAIDANIGALQGSGDLDLGSQQLTIGAKGFVSTYSGIISGTGSLKKTGDQTLVLVGANTFSGGITIEEGSVALNHSSGAGTGTITVLGGSVGYVDGVNIANTIDLQDNANFNVSIGSATQSGAIRQTDGAFGITKTGDGILFLSGTNTSTGPTQVDGGILGITGGTTRSSTTNISASGSLVVTGGTFIAAGTIANDRTLSIAMGGRLTGNGTNGANGADGDPFGTDGGAGSSGRMITSTGTVLMSGSSQTTLNGGSGGSGGDGNFRGGRGGDGGRGGTISLTGGSATIGDSVTLNLNGGAGGSGGRSGPALGAPSGIGGSGGVLSLAGGATGSISGSATVRLNGASGRVSGRGGDINVSEGTLSIFDSTAVSLNGATGSSGGDGGRGGDLNVSGGMLSISDSAAVTLNGGTGVDRGGLFPAVGDGGRGGTLAPFPGEPSRSQTPRWSTSEADGVGRGLCLVYLTRSAEPVERSSSPTGS